MKKNLFTMILCACAFTSLSFYSCSQESTSSQGPTTAKSYTVHLGFGGEITNISTSPLTKAVVADSDLYGIQVYSCPATSSSSPTYTQYAYGLFNNKSDMTVNLLQGYIYKFVCTMVVNGKNKLYGYNGGYAQPYHTNSNGVAQLNNQFTYSTSGYFDGLVDGSSWLSSDSKFYNRPNTDRYYGELAGFTPAENASASISMKRVAFGAKFIADGLTDGKLKISMKEAPDIYITYPDTTVQDIFTFDNNYGFNPMAWTQDDYSEAVSTSITWIKADGATIPLATQDITFKRNMLTTITVKVNDNSSKNGIDINKETTSMGDGGSVTITGSSSDSTTVNP